MYSNLFINIKKPNHDFSDREKKILNLLITQAIVSINDQITQVPIGLHEQTMLSEDLLHHHVAFVSTIEHDMLENLKESINTGIFSILQTLGVEDFNISYYLSN